MNVIVAPIKWTTTKTHKGFWMSLQPETDLDLAILIVEDEEKNHRPLTTNERVGPHAPFNPADVESRG